MNVVGSGFVPIIIYATIAGGFEPPPGELFMVTEIHDYMQTEAGDFMITE